jgi:hypothetical protein
MAFKKEITNVSIILAVILKEITWIWWLILVNPALLRLSQ